MHNVPTSRADVQRLRSILTHHFHLEPVAYQGGLVFHLPIPEGAPPLVYAVPNPEGWAAFASDELTESEIVERLNGRWNGGAHE